LQDIVSKVTIFIVTLKRTERVLKHSLKTFLLDYLPPDSDQVCNLLRDLRDL